MHAPNIMEGGLGVAAEIRWPPAGVMR
jgi:hypothetical protein